MVMSANVLWLTTPRAQVQALLAALRARLLSGQLDWVRLETGDVVLLEPFWDSCDAVDCQLAWFRSNASTLAPHPATSPGPSFPSA